MSNTNDGRGGGVPPYRMSIGGVFGPWGAQPQNELQGWKQRCEQLEETINRIRAAPMQLAVVQRVSKERVILNGGANRVEVARPKGEVGRDLRPGMVVKIMGDTLQITEVLGYDLPAGDVLTVKQILDENRAEISTPMGSIVVMLGAGKPRAGDRVLLDATKSAIADVLAEPEGGGGRFAIVDDTGVVWDDVAGLELAKSDLQEAIEGPFKHAAVYKRFGMQPLKGVLLYGPPGNGKTMLGKAAASAIAEIHGAKHEGAFLYVKGPELLDKFLGATEAAIRGIFASARSHHKRHGYPAVIFVDEADSLLAARAQAGSNLHSMAQQTVVPQFLTEMDGLEESSALVILATNRPDVLDPAVIREGRIDRKVLIPRPTRETAAKLVARLLAKAPLQGELAAMVEFTVDRAYSDANVLAEVLTKKDSPTKHLFTLAHVISGAMLTGIVEKAKSKAIKREIERGEEIGITRDDIGAAIQRMTEEQRGIDLSEPFQAFIVSLKEKPTNIKKIEPVIH